MEDSLRGRRHGSFSGLFAKKKDTATVAYPMGTRNKLAENIDAKPIGRIGRQRARKTLLSWLPWFLCPAR